ncbi:hypothetical protein BO1005MUT1_220060 [Hyphomicrobiales bacterium]|nr:hypothetical protein BO1005MUT1_220060 [Hyphomicrobiales bacterium]
MISQFVEGTMNVLKLYGTLAGPIGRSGKNMDVFIGHDRAAVPATQGGLVEHLVKLNDKVIAEQNLAIQRNSFSKVIAEYTSPAAGEVAGRCSDAIAEPGDNLAVILVEKAGPVDET